MHLSELPRPKKQLPKLAEEAERLKNKLSQNDEIPSSLNSAGEFLEDVEQLLPSTPVTPNVGLSKEERRHYNSVCDTLKIVATKHPDLFPQCIRFQIILSCYADGFGMMPEPVDGFEY